MKTEIELESNLRRIITWGSSLGGGAMAVTLQSYRPPLFFAFSIYTVAAFALGFGTCFAFWKLFFAERKDHRSKILFFAVIMILIAGGLAGVLYPLRFVVQSEMKNLFIGLATAVCALSVGAALLMTCKRFFDEDERNNTETKHDDDEAKKL